MNRRPADRIAWVLFATLVATCLVVGAVFVIEERPHEDVERDGETVRVYLGHGIDHPRHAEILQGGDGTGRHGHLLWLGWAFAMLQVAFLTTCLVLGMTKTGGKGPATVPLVVVGLAGAAIVTCLFVSYRDYLIQPGDRFFLGFPAPTAWMVFGIWLFPLLFAAVFVFFFDRWYLTPEALEGFRRRVIERSDGDSQEGEEGEDGG